MNRWNDLGQVLRGLFLDNLLYKVVAFLFAVGIWALVQSEQVVEDRFRVPVRWVLPDGLVTAELPLDSVTITLQGVQTYVRAVRQKELGLTVDLSSASEGEVNVDLAALPVEGLAEAVRVTSIAPANLQVTLERQIKRKVAVQAVTRGEVAAGYVLGRVRVNPERVELVGPDSLLRGLEEVLTDPVDISTLREPAEFPVGLNIKKGQVALAKPTAITVSVDVVPVVEERRFDGVPVVVRGAGSWTTSVSAVQVTLAGPTDSLAAIGPDALSVLVYVPEGFIGEGEARLGGDGLRFEVVHPGGAAVNVSRVEPAAIAVGARAAP